MKYAEHRLKTKMGWNCWLLPSEQERCGGISEERGPQLPQSCTAWGKLRLRLIHKENQAQSSAVLPGPPCRPVHPIPPPAPALRRLGRRLTVSWFAEVWGRKKPSRVRHLHLWSLSRQGNPLHLGAEKKFPTSAFQPRRT